MANKMIIDASHPEETRVVVLRGNRVEEFDFESASKKQLRGNIYLAKVTRVEPSLQAAFVEYGGNRHGFLAFSEIHPDYYQIPHSDRAALLEEESRAHREEDDEDSSRRRSRRNRRGSERRRPSDDERVTGELSNESEQAAFDAEANGQSEDVVYSVDENAVVQAETAEFAPTEEFAPATVEAETEEAAAADAPVEPVAEAAPQPHAERHEIASDPEGFAIVEEDSADESQAAQGAVDASAERSEAEAPAFVQHEGDVQDHDNSQEYRHRRPCRSRWLLAHPRQLDDACRQCRRVRAAL